MNKIYNIIAAIIFALNNAQAMQLPSQRQQHIMTECPQELRKIKSALLNEALGRISDKDCISHSFFEFPLGMFTAQISVNSFKLFKDSIGKTRKNWAFSNIERGRCVFRNKNNFIGLSFISQIENIRNKEEVFSQLPDDLIKKIFLAFFSDWENNGIGDVINILFVCKKFFANIKIIPLTIRFPSMKNKDVFRSIRNLNIEKLIVNCNGLHHDRSIIFPRDNKYVIKEFCWVGDTSFPDIIRGSIADNNNIKKIKCSYLSSHTLSNILLGVISCNSPYLEEIEISRLFLDSSEKDDLIDNLCAILSHNSSLEILGVSTIKSLNLFMPVQPSGLITEEDINRLKNSINSDSRLKSCVIDDKELLRVSN
jgi:hypothetical protein